MPTVTFDNPNGPYVIAGSVNTWLEGSSTITAVKVDSALPRSVVLSDKTKVYIDGAFVGRLIGAVSINGGHSIFAKI